VTLTATQTATHVVTSTATTNTKRIPVLHLKGNGCRDQETGLDRCQISKEITPTLERIKRGIKDPHRNDGTIFTNREGILPRQRSDYYHEYVVPTPGQSGPGARRIVMGAKGEIYYTRDHYASFIQVIV
jgi:guanyl-specific ribonuclease Sa